MKWSHYQPGRTCSLRQLSSSSVCSCTHRRWSSSWCWSQYRCIDVITGEWVLDVEASTGVLMWSQMVEFLMLKPVQVPSRPHFTEQSFSEDVDVVSFAWSKAQSGGPFCVFLGRVYDIAWTEFRTDITGIISPTATANISSIGLGANLLSAILLFAVPSKIFMQNADSKDNTKWTNSFSALI